MGVSIIYFLIICIYVVSVTSLGTVMYASWLIGCSVHHTSLKAEGREVTFPMLLSEHLFLHCGHEFGPEI